MPSIFCDSPDVPYLQKHQGHNIPLPHSPAQPILCSGDHFTPSTSNSQLRIAIITTSKSLDQCPHLDLQSNDLNDGLIDTAQFQERAMASKSTEFGYFRRIWKTRGGIIGLLLSSCPIEGTVERVIIRCDRPFSRTVGARWCC